MVYKNRQALYDEAVRLRMEEGLGYKSIAKRLNYEVHWSTTSNWVSKIIVDPDEAYRKALAEAKTTRWPTRKDPIRKRLIEERGHRCQSCKLATWLGQPIKLEMHRIRGKGEYIRENVLLLCPNCHAQTNNWKNKGA